MKSVMQQIEDRFKTFQTVAYKISSYIPTGEVISEIIKEAEKDSLLNFVKLYRVSMFGMPSSGEDGGNYVKCVSVFYKLKKKWENVFLPLDEYANMEALKKFTE